MWDTTRAGVLVCPSPIHWIHTWNPNWMCPISLESIYEKFVESNQQRPFFPQREAVMMLETQLTLKPL